jgi:DNA repair exonuclease SbcCD ATPase subunit
MTKANFVKKARKDYPEANIKAGESYYWWKFNFRRGIHRSKTQPTRQQLTTSDFLSNIYGIEDSIGDIDANSEDIAAEVESITNEIENLSSETDDKLSNMPDQLQESSSSGQLLQSRVDSLSEFQSNLEGVDTEIDEQSIREEATDKFLSKKCKTLEQLDDTEKQELEEKVKEGIKNRKQEIVDELHDTSYGGE